MSSSSQNEYYDRLFAMLLWIVGIAGACFVLYWAVYWIAFAVLWIIPYVIFCGIPFVVLSLGMGAAWAFGCHATPTRDADEKDLPMGVRALYGESSDDVMTKIQAEEVRRFWSKHPALGRLDYRRLVLFIPITVAIAYGIFDVPKPHEHAMVPVQVATAATEGGSANADPGAAAKKPAKKLKAKPPGPVSEKLEDRVVLQWPGLYETFNDFNGWWQGVFTFLREGRPYEFVLFDRNFMSVVVWLAIFLGAPLTFFGIARDDVARERREQARAIELAVSCEAQTWGRKEEAWQARETKLNGYLDQWKVAFDRQKKELEKYKTKEEFVTGLKIQIEEAKAKPGLLDSDVL